MVLYIQLQDITLCGLLLALIFLWRIISAHVRSNKSDSRPPEPAGAWPFIGHLHLLGANKILHHTLGAMADKNGPIFSLQLGIHRTLVVSSWEVAKECFTTHDKVFSTRPKSLAAKLMAYDHAVIGFLPYGPYWRDIRKLAIVELLSTHRLDILKHVRESEVNIFIRELYKQWISSGGGSKAVVEMKERFGDLTMNIVVRMVAGKRYFGTGVHGDEESRRCQKAMGDFLHLLGLFMVSDAVPLFGWVDALRGYKGEMKKTAKEIDHVLGSWVKEHRQKRESQSIDESEQDFIHVLLSAMDGSRFTERDTDTSVKGTCLHQHMAVPTARAMIESLHGMFGEQARAVRQSIMKSLMEDKMAEGTPVGEHCLKFISRFSELEVLGANVDVETQVDMLLQSLPDTFNNFRVNYNMGQFHYTLTELMKQLQSAQGILVPKPDIHVAEANIAKAKARKKKKPNKKKKNAKLSGTGGVGKKQGQDEVKPKGKCFHCGEKGHWKRNCSVYLEKVKNKGVPGDQKAK